LYFMRTKKYLIPYIAFASLTHLLLTKGNIPVFISDLGLALFLYSLIIWMKEKFRIKSGVPA